MGAAAAVATVVSAAATVYSGMESASAQREAAREAERIAGLNAAAQEAETAEEARRLGAEQREEQSLARAKAAASGVKLTGSTQSYLEAKEEEDKKQLDWLKKAGASRSGITRQVGAAEASRYRSQAKATTVSTVAGAAGSASDIYTKGKAASWWT